MSDSAREEGLAAPEVASGLGCCCHCSSGCASTFASGCGAGEANAVFISGSLIWIGEADS